jgi:hypothetical protein
MFVATDHLIGIKFGKGIHNDYMNNLKDKCICSVADYLGYLQYAIQKTIHKVFICQSKLTTQTMVNPISTLILLITAYKTILAHTLLSQACDQTNPLTEIIHG